MPKTCPALNLSQICPNTSTKHSKFPNHPAKAFKGNTKGPQNFFIIGQTISKATQYQQAISTLSSSEQAYRGSSISRQAFNTSYNIQRQRKEALRIVIHHRAIRHQTYSAGPQKEEEKEAYKGYQEEEEKRAKS